MNRFVLLFALMLGVSVAGAAEGPNILFIFSDDHAVKAQYEVKVDDE